MEEEREGGVRRMANEWRNSKEIIKWVAIEKSWPGKNGIIFAGGIISRRIREQEWNGLKNGV